MEWRDTRKAFARNRVNKYRLRSLRSPRYCVRENLVRSVAAGHLQTGTPTVTRELTGDQFGLQIRCGERITFEVPSHLAKEPAVNPKRSFMGLVVMSRMADWAFGLGLLFGVVECERIESQCDGNVEAETS